MGRAIFFVAALLLAFAPAPARAQDGFYFVGAYDPARDPRADLAVAMQRAATENKRILLIVGGDWCAPCHTLDRYFQRRAQARDAFGETFVIMKVNVSRENTNRSFLAGYPSGELPHFIVLDATGRLLASQSSGSLSNRDNFDHTRMMAFVELWRP